MKSPSAISLSVIAAIGFACIAGPAFAANVSTCDSSGGSTNGAKFYGVISSTTLTVNPTASFTGSISGHTLTVSGVTGTIAIGQAISGSGVGTHTITAGSGTSWTLNGGTLTLSARAISSAFSAATTGTIAAHQTISGTGVTSGTTISSGSGNSWTVSPSQTATTVAMTTTEDLSGAQIATLLGNSGSFTSSGSYIYAVDSSGQGDHEAWFGSAPGTGDLYDFKRGFSSSTDPAGKVGSATISSGVPGTISYTYTSGAHAVFYLSYLTQGQNSGAGSYLFCSTNTAAPADTDQVTITAKTNSPG